MTFTKLTELEFNPVIGVGPTVIERSLLETAKADDNSFTNGTKFSGYNQIPQLYLSGYSRSTCDNDDK